MLVAELGGPTMFARIGVMRALNRHVERVYDLSRKEKHGGAGNWRGTGENSAFTRLCIDERAGTWAHLRATAVEHCQELALVSWDKSFDRPVVLPDGRMLRTLEDARQYILTLPKSEQASTAWEVAIEALLLAAEKHDP